MCGCSAKRLRLRLNLAQGRTVAVIRPRGVLGISAVAKVLVVDDDPAVQLMIKLVLERETQASPTPDRNVAAGR
jgi:hypothetical protein